MPLALVVPLHVLLMEIAQRPNGGVEVLLSDAECEGGSPNQYEPEMCKEFTDRLAPWVHYVPIQNIYPDLYDALVFFRGNLAGRGAHEELVAKIAREGMEWSLTFWRKEAVVAFCLSYCLEYARVMSEDRNSLMSNWKMVDDYVKVGSFQPDSSSDDIVLPESFMGLTI
ncbi:hypothetical protein AZE42_04968 [Rhizopogon vesiculosus]|uniref:Uncharacterized protein n=1 Tax=Rhizopogon vesiculosus TaxID=180088 RepID=A0A1J8Q103_9AGAM|nr:hypothetical protein AZE42_04968 [Rhizopogon vesiculosus]